MFKYVMLYVMSVVMFYVLRDTSPALGLLVMMAGFTLPAVKVSWRVAVIEDRRAGGYHGE